MTTPARHIAFDALHNFRDLGGYRTGDGRSVRWGRLYRADSLSKLASESDWAVFAELKIRSVIDLRHGFEIEARGRIPERADVVYHHLSIEHHSYDQPGQRPEVAAGPFLAGKYLEIAEDGVVELRQALEVIADPEAGPVVFHCAGGKDRTGQLAATVLALLDVDESEIVADYALTGLATTRLRADWSAFHGGAEPRWPAYGTAPGEVMELFLTGLTARYGSVRGYAEQRLGVDAALLARLRSTLLEE